MEQFDNATPYSDGGSPMKSIMSQEEASVEISSPLKTDFASEDDNMSETKTEII